MLGYLVDFFVTFTDTEDDEETSSVDCVFILNIFNTSSNMIKSGNVKLDVPAGNV